MVKLKRVQNLNLEPNELLVRIKVRSEDPADHSIFYDIEPSHHADMEILSEIGLETMRDVVKAMCVVTTFPPEEISYLVDRYDTMFDDEHPTVEVFSTDDTNGTIH
jgi:hypothetical protein